MSGILSCNSHPELANAISAKTDIPIIKYNIFVSFFSRPNDVIRTIRAKRTFSEK